MDLGDRAMIKVFKNVGKILLGISIVCIALIALLFFNGGIGVSKSKLESDIRTSQNINEDWSIEGNISDTMAAFISYPEDKTDHTYSVYVNRPGCSIGYFFRGGGDLAGTGKYIAEYTVEGYKERAFISMNEPKVERIEIDDGNSLQVIDVDSDKPFAIVLPVNAGAITFYDVNGNTVEYLNNPL